MKVVVYVDVHVCVKFHEDIPRICDKKGGVQYICVLHNVTGVCVCALKGKWLGITRVTGVCVCGMASGWESHE